MLPGGVLPEDVKSPCGEPGGFGGAAAGVRGAQQPRGTATQCPGCCYMAYFFANTYPLFALPCGGASCLERTTLISQGYRLRQQEHCNDVSAGRN